MGQLNPNEKTFVVTYQHGNGYSTEEIKAESVKVEGDFLIVVGPDGKGVAAFPSSKVLKVVPKTGL